MKVRAKTNSAARFLELGASKPFRHKLPHERHPCLSANENHLIEVLRVQLRVRKRTQAVRARAQDYVAREVFEFLARQLVAETESRREKGQLNFGFRFSA